MLAHLLLIDDHALFRTGFSLVLAGGLDDVVIHEAASLAEALRQSVTPTMIMLDVQLDGLSGLEGMGSLRRRWPHTAIVIVSAFATSELLDNALRRGACGYISKAERPEIMLQRVDGLLRPGDQAPLAAAPVEPLERSRLTPRQCEVLDLLCQGLSNKVIGRRLNVSEHTVRGHVQAMLAALQVSSRSEAAFVARRLGLVR